MERYHAMAKESFSIEKENGLRSSFTRNQEYECLKRGNGNFVIKDNEGSAAELEACHALECFWIKEA